MVGDLALAGYQDQQTNLDRFYVYILSGPVLCGQMSAVSRTD